MRAMKETIREMRHSDGVKEQLGKQGLARPYRDEGFGGPEGCRGQMSTEAPNLEVPIMERTQREEEEAAKKTKNKDLRCKLGSQSNEIQGEKGV